MSPIDHDLGGLQEILIALGLIGVTSVSQLDASYVCRATPVGPCHEMSAFTHLPGGRLL